MSRRNRLSAVMRWVSPRSMRFHSALVMRRGREIVRKDPFRSLFASVNRERDALVQEGEVGRMLAAPDLVGGQAKKMFLVEERSADEVCPDFQTSRHRRHRRDNSAATGWSKRLISAKPMAKYKVQRFRLGNRVGVELRGRSRRDVLRPPGAPQDNGLTAGWRSFIDSPHQQNSGLRQGRYQLDPAQAWHTIRAQLRFLSFAEDSTELYPSLYFRLKG